MSKPFKPMRACPVDLTKLTYPLAASPKLDGIRCVLTGGQVLSKSLKPIPNLHIQKLYSDPIYSGLDGELIIDDPTAYDCYHKTHKGVMTVKGEPNVTYWVFDIIDPTMGFHDRYRQILAAEKKGGLLDNPKFKVVPYSVIESEAQLKLYESAVVGMGYEGVILRSLDGKYKYGRSTTNEGWLLKWKRFEDAEAVIIGFTELEHNQNAAFTNEVGETTRSTHQDNKVKGDTLGNFVVRDLITNVEFEIGTGFTAAQRKEYWDNKETLTGKIVKYKFFPVGVLEKPRHPVFLGFRDKIDL